MDNQSQQLPAKDATLFKQVVKFYETKQYKKGIKAADQVLKKHPEHGETLAMKGLILSVQEKAGVKPEAYELVRRGLKNNLKSHVCWHVYGLLWRADNNYEEATKCYKNALRMDKENLQILRDLAQLQIQQREYGGYIETRNTLLQLKSSNRQNWISLALAHHLNKDYDVAVQILKGYEGVQEGVAPDEGYEHSELMLYKAMVLEEGGRFSEALHVLDSNREDLRDQLGYQEAKAGLLFKLGRTGEAEKCYRQLLDQNPDNYEYHNSLRKALGLVQSNWLRTWSAKQQEQLEKVYQELAEKYPRHSTPRRMQLDFLEGEAFRQALDKYIRRFLTKGIPSLFSELKGLYGTPAKVEVIQAVFQRILEGLGSDPDTLAPLLGQEDEGSASGGEPAGEALLWTRLFLARHFDRIGQTERALQLVEESETEHSDVLEVYTTKAVVLKHAGDLQGAAEAADKAQSLDKADRYLNCIAAKALFRADETARAEHMASLFFKAAEQPNTLHEMQCMWYEIECGSSYLRQRNYGKALKNFLEVIKHFAVFKEDQFDFHGYCVRKMTLRNYVSMLRMEDDILQNKFYTEAAFGAVETYLELAARGPQQQQNLLEEESLMASMSLDDRKKYKLKKKKDAQKKAKEEDRIKAAANQEREKEVAKGKKVGEKPASTPTDPDPEGKELAAVEAPLEEAAKLLQVLRENAQGNLNTHVLGFEVAMRREKRLLALQAVQRGVALVGKSQPQVHSMLMRLCHAVLSPSLANGHAKEEAVSGSEEVVQKVLRSHVEGLLGGKSLQAYHQAFAASEARKSPSCGVAAADIDSLLDPSRKEAVLAAFVSEDTPLEPSEGGRADHGECQAVHAILAGKLAAPEAASRWAERCRAEFPWSTHFKGARRTAKPQTPPPSANGS